MTIKPGLDSTLNDPRYAYPRPPFPHQKQAEPGSDQAMQPSADHGEMSYHGSQKLLGKVALITGGDSGIGRAVAIAYAREGADVVLSYLGEVDDAVITASYVQKAGRQALCIAGDITDEKHCQAIVAETMQRFGRIDILVNNAAWQNSHEDIQEFSSEQFEKTFRTNVFAAFYLAKAAMQHMQAGSAIINTVSIQAFAPSAILLDYAATKSALVGFTKALSKLAIKQGIRVNAVAPGPVWTPLIPSTMPDDMVTHFGEKNPLGRPAQPAEFGAVYVLLASSEGSYITGEVYGLTGGEMPV